MTFALVDCNNFYASCQRVFNPALRKRPIVVLSNNDGCVIARSNEAKQLGIKMGVPAYQIQQQIKTYNIAVFSSNYSLYANMSSRVMSILQEYVYDLDCYSIDESFLNMTGMEHMDLNLYGKQIVKSVSKGTGIPVSMGIGATKTLAKVANKFAKKYPKYDSVCIIDSEEKRIKALRLTDIEDVWGIGRRYSKMLQANDCNTAYEFTLKNRSWVRKYMSVVGERLWLELQGTACADLEITPAKKKELCTSRSFDKPVTNLKELNQAVTTYTAVAAERLRKQGGCCTQIMVFLHTNYFRTDIPQYNGSEVIQLPVPTNSTIELAEYARQVLSLIYREGYAYKKAGVILLGIIDDTAVQMNLFDTVDRSKHTALMKVIDRYNTGFNHSVIRLATQGTKKDSLNLKREFISPCYSTNINDIISIKCH